MLVLGMVVFVCRCDFIIWIFYVMLVGLCLFSVIGLKLFNCRCWFSYCLLFCWVIWLCCLMCCLLRMMIGLISLLFLVCY